MALHLLADENFPAPAVMALRGRGHNVAWVWADAPGSPDRQVLARAVAEQRTLMTFDKDFGELVFHRGLRAPAGIVLFRITAPSALYVAQFVVKILESRMDWTGYFAVAEEKRLRVIPLP